MTNAREMRVKGQVFKQGDWISLDGSTGRVIKGKKNCFHPIQRSWQAEEVPGLGGTIPQNRRAR